MFTYFTINFNDRIPDSLFAKRRDTSLYVFIITDRQTDGRTHGRKNKRKAILYNYIAFTIFYNTSEGDDFYMEWLMELMNLQVVWQFVDNSSRDLSLSPYKVFSKTFTKVQEFVISPENFKI